MSSHRNFGVRAEKEVMKGVLAGSKTGQRAWGGRGQHSGRVPEWCQGGPKGPSGAGRASRQSPGRAFQLLDLRESRGQSAVLRRRCVFFEPVLTVCREWVFYFPSLTLQGGRREGVWFSALPAAGPVVSAALVSLPDPGGNPQTGSPDASWCSVSTVCRTRFSFRLP